MGSKIIFILGIFFLISMAAFSAFLFFKSEDLKIVLSQTEYKTQNYQDQLKDIGVKMVTLLKSKQNLEEETLSYSKFTYQLQEDKRILQTQLEDYQKKEKNKDKSIEDLNKQLKKLKSKISKVDKFGIIDIDSVRKENQELKKKTILLEAILKEERALQQYNLGVAYVQAGLLEESLIAYKKSLSFDSKNAEAHYNLGLLYQNFKNRPEEAIFYYQKYLEFKPDAEDSSEVELWINKLIQESIKSN